MFQHSGSEICRSETYQELCFMICNFFILLYEGGSKITRIFFWKGLVPSSPVWCVYSTARRISWPSGVLEERSVGSVWFFLEPLSLCAAVSHEKRHDYGFTPPILPGPGTLRFFSCFQEWRGTLKESVFRM